MALADGGEGAVVMKGETCWVPGVRGEQDMFPTADSQLVVTPSGNATLVCHGELPEGPPRTLHFNDLPCFDLQNRRADDSHAVVTRSGKVHFVCHFRAD